MLERAEEVGRPRGEAFSPDACVPGLSGTERACGRGQAFSPNPPGGRCLWLIRDNAGTQTSLQRLRLSCQLVQEKLVQKDGFWSSQRHREPGSVSHCSWHF